MVPMVVQVMTQRHSMLRRQALLLRAGMEPLTDADRARLQVALVLAWTDVDSLRSELRR